MRSQAENSKSLIESEAAHIASGFHIAKRIFTQATDSVKVTTQQAKASIAETTDTVVDRVSAIAASTQTSISEKFEQSKESIGQIKSTTSDVFQIAIASSTNSWLQTHPSILRLLQILDWAVNHPIFSLVIFLFTLALIWSLIKSIGRLFELAWLSILQVPFKLGKFLIQACLMLIGKFSSFLLKPSTGNINTETAALLSSAPEPIDQNKQQRLLEISQRLEALKQEQDELLQEAIALLNSKTQDLEPISNKQHQIFSALNEQPLQFPVLELDKE
jgi:Fe2+ transport system protein B